MMNLRFSPYRVLLITMTACWLFSAGAFAAAAADEKEGDDADTMSVIPALPKQVKGVDASASYVGVNGSREKFREDHNTQSGAELGLNAQDDSEKGKLLYFNGRVRPVEKQGYGRFGYDRLGSFSVDGEVQAWTEFYNTRPGVKDETILGTPLDPSGVYPNTTDSRSVFGGGKPNVDWLTLRGGVDLELGGPFNDAYADVMYRTIKGEMSLAKGGTIFDPAAVPPVIPGSGPGTVAFDFPGRKDVDYETIGGLVGTRSSLGGIAWRLDATAFKHEIKSDTREANFGVQPSTGEIESFREDTDLTTAGANLVGSRQVLRNLFVYGGGVFNWSRSDPNPSQSVQSGIFPATTSDILTRGTGSSDVKRFSESLNAGAVFQPTNTIVSTVDLSFRASQQEGDLFEIRNESTFLTGDSGSVTNHSERDHMTFLARGDVTWKATRRMGFKAHASYKYTGEENESERDLAFVVLEPRERENYDVDRERIKAGVSGKYRFKAGRKLELGYDFMYEGADTEVNDLENQFIMADYERYQHKIFAKASGRIYKKLRGDLRAQYIFEDREMDAPLVDAQIIPSLASDGKMEYQGFTIVPTLTYQHSSTLSGYASLSVGRQVYSLENGQDPVGFDSRFASFEYEAMTESATLGVNWSPTERLSGTAIYTIYHNDKSVNNTGHNASVRGAYALNEDWDLTSGLRYLGYDPSSNSLDDYDTIIFTLGLGGTF